MSNYNLRALSSALEAARRDPIQISISKGNTKLGDIPSFSLLPVVTCSPEARKTCAVNGCYAVKNVFRCGYNPATNSPLNAWSHNTAAALDHLPELETHLTRYFDSMNAPRFFRVHVSGDFITADYAEMWKRIIISHPHTNFLFFTKQWDILRKVDFLNIPNLAPILSGWTGCSIPDDLIQAGYRIVWCNDGHETRIPTTAIECPGHCENCGMCWNLYTIGRDTYFNKH